MALGLVAKGMGAQGAGKAASGAKMAKISSKEKVVRMHLMFLRLNK